jgi:hypothetical protein
MNVVVVVVVCSSTRESLSKQSTTKQQPRGSGLSSYNLRSVENDLFVSQGRSSGMVRWKAIGIGLLGLDSCCHKDIFGLRGVIFILKYHYYYIKDRTKCFALDENRT